MWNFIRCFLCIYWDDYVNFIFPFVNVVYHIDWYVTIEQSLWPWINSHRNMVYDPLYCWRFLKKLSLEILYDLAIPLLGMHRKKTKTLIKKDTCTYVSIAALFTKAKIWKQPKCPPTDESIKRMWCICVYTYNGMKY